MRGKIHPKSEGERTCATCAVLFSPSDDRQIYCCAPCRHNSPGKKLRTKAFQQSRRDKINALKMAKGCFVCGYNAHPAALDFNHVRGDKLFNVSQDPKIAWEKLLAEVEKCEVLCANCHRIYTQDNRHWLTKRKQK